MPVSSFFCSEITGKVVTAQKKVKIGNKKQENVCLQESKYNCLCNMIMDLGKMVE